MAFSNVECRLVRRQAAAAQFELRSNRVSVRVDELHVVAAAEWHGAALQETVIDAEAVVEVARATLERAVNLAPQLVPHDEEHDERCNDNSESDRRRGDERQPGAEAHGSRSA